MIAQAGVSFVNDLFSNFWIALVVKAVVVLGFFLVAPMAVGYAEHKVLAHMQARLGPMEAGMFHGWAQLVADGVKFIQKEDVVPAAADSWVFSLAPAVAMIPYIALFVVIPFSNTLYAENLDVGIFFVLAMSSVSVIGVLMAGWSSANKFSLIGALRAAAQLIAYELPIVLAAAAIVIQAGTLSMIGIVEAQHSFPFVLTQFIGNILRGEAIRLVDGGSQRRCFTDIEDGIDGLMAILENRDGRADGQIETSGVFIFDPIKDLLSIPFGFLFQDGS